MAESREVAQLALLRRTSMALLSFFDTIRLRHTHKGVPRWLPGAMTGENSRDECRQAVYLPGQVVSPELILPAYQVGLWSWDEVHRQANLPCTAVERICGPQPGKQNTTQTVYHATRPTRNIGVRLIASETLGSRWKGRPSFATGRDSRGHGLRSSNVDLMALNGSKGITA